MGIKLIIDTTEIELPRGSQLPREGDIFHVKLKGVREESTYIVYSIEHIYDFNMSIPIGQNRVTLKPVSAVE